MLKTYEQFIERAGALGFLAFHGRTLPGLPSLQSETLPRQWHTGDPDTDPWQWKDRAAAERKLAFGCVLGGQKGFIAPRAYPLFFAACRPAEDMEVRYRDGLVSGACMRVYRLLEGGGVLDTGDIRKALGATKKSGAGAIDSALRELQRRFIVAVCGNRRKTSLRGAEYGWPANAYCLAERWALPEWLEEADALDPREARERILDLGLAISDGIDRTALEALLFG